MATEQTFNYASRTYSTIRQDLLTRANKVSPEWTDRDPSDFGMLFVDLWSYMGDILHYYVDRAGRESFISTATQRESLVAYANMFGYVPSGRASAMATVYISNSSSASTYSIPAGTKFSAVSDNKIYYFYNIDDATVGPSVSAAVNLFEGTKIVDEVLSTSASGAPNQSYLIGYSDADMKTTSVYVTEDGVKTLWLRYASVQEIPKNARGFVVSLAASGDVRVTFGNRTNGFIPPSGSTITINYTRSSGVNGNIGSNLINSFVSSTPSYITINGSTSATGGSNGETAETLKTNIVSYMRTQDRAVTLVDYADLTKSVNGVYKAVATYTPTSGANASVNLYALPYTSDFLTMTGYSIAVPAALRTSILSFVTPRSMLGVTPVAVSSIPVVRLDIDITVTVSDGFVRSWVETNVKNAINGLLDFDNTDFGKQLRKSEVYKTVMALDGIDYIDITAFEMRSSAAASGNIVTTLDPASVLRKGNIGVTMLSGMSV
jgi:hypothetical protein